MAIAPSWQLNAYTAGSWFNRVDLPWNRLDMRIQVIVPEGEANYACNPENKVYSPTCFLGSFQWHVGAWALYIPMVVPHIGDSTSRYAHSYHNKNYHHQYVNPVLLQEKEKNMHDFTNNAKAYSLDERKSHLKEIFDPKLFDKAVKQLLILEKFKDNPYVFLVFFFRIFFCFYVFFSNLFFCYFAFGMRVETVLEMCVEMFVLER